MSKLVVFLFSLVLFPAVPLQSAARQTEIDAAWGGEELPFDKLSSKAKWCVSFYLQQANDQRSPRLLTEEEIAVMLIRVAEFIVDTTVQQQVN